MSFSTHVLKRSSALDIDVRVGNVICTYGVQVKMLTIL